MDGICAASHFGQNVGSFLIVPVPVLPLSCVHVHCVEGHEHCTLYFVSPQLHDELDVQPPLASIAVSDWICEQFGGRTTSVVLPSFLMTPPSLPLPLSTPPVLPPSPVSMMPPQAVSATQKIAYPHGCERYHRGMAARLQTVRILWMGLFFSSLLLLFMITSHVVHDEEAHMPPHMPEMLGALALGIAIISIVLPARGFDAALRAMDVSFENEVGEPVGSFRESAPTRKLIAKPHDTVLAAFTRYQTPFIIGMALAESISLFGFMLGFMGAHPYAYAPFFALGLGLMAWKFPRLVTITSALERVKGAELRF